MTYALLAAFRRDPAEPRADAGLVAGLTAALLAHFVSMQFGPAVVTGRLYFWALAGLLVARGRLETATEEAEDAGAAWEIARVALPAAALGLVIAFAFAGLKAGGGGHAAYGSIALLSGLAMATWTALSARTWRTAGIAGAAAAAVTAAYALGHLHALASTAQVRSMAELFAALGAHFTRIALLSVAAVIALGVALGRSRAARPTTAGALRLGGALAVALALVVPPTLASVNADVLRNFASAFMSQNRLREAALLLEEAVRLAPGDAVHHQAYGEAMLAASRAREEQPRVPQILERGEAAFRRARELDPLGPDHTANLARVARRRAETDPDPASARRHAEEAARLYAEAVALVPGNTLLLDETAELDFQRLGDFDAAERKLQRSRELDPTFDYTHAALGDLYMARARARGAKDDYARAAAAYEEAHLRRKSLKALVGVAFARKEMGDAAAAIRALEEALAMPPPAAVAWSLNEQLAGLYAAQGDAASAQRHATFALQQVPEKDKAPLQARLRAAGVLGGP
jgi:tetratricopeptide (TPR) repeat protein